MACSASEQTVAIDPDTITVAIDPSTSIDNPIHSYRANHAAAFQVPSHLPTHPSTNLATLDLIATHGVNTDQTGQLARCGNCTHHELSMDASPYLHPHPYPYPYPHHTGYICDHSAVDIQSLSAIRLPNISAATQPNISAASSIGQPSVDHSADHAGRRH